MMTPRIKPRIASVSGGIFCAAFFLAPAAQTAWAQTAPVQTTFPVSSAAPIRFADTPAPQTTDYNAYQREARVSLPPISRVRQDAKGNSDSTAAVNYLTAFSPFSPDGTAPADIWLGTQYGIKHIVGKTVRYYFKEAGLPGDYVESISADKETVFALVRVPRTGQSYSNGNSAPDQIALCAWNKTTDNWSVLTRANTLFPQPDYQRFGYNQEQAALRDLQAQQGKGVLIQSDNFAAFASGVVSTKDDAITYLWDKKAQRVSPLAWEPAFKAAAPAYVGISFLFMDEAHQTLWLGTSQGLLAYDLVKQTWRTVLAGKPISAGAATPDKTSLYVASQLPLPFQSSDAPTLIDTDSVPAAKEKEPVALWRLTRVDLPSGEAVEMPLPPAPSLPKPEEYPFQKPTGNIDRLFVSGTTVWATQTGILSRGFGGQSSEKAGIVSFDTRTKTWETVALSATHLVFSRNAPPVLQADPNYAQVQARLDAVPDAVLAPLALRDNGSDPYSYAVYADTMAYLPAYWITHRFPSWYGETDTAAQTAAQAPYALASPPEGTAASEKRRWFVRNDTLFFNPASAKGNETISAETQAYPLHATLSGFRPPVKQMVSADPKTPSLLLVQSERALFLVNAKNGLWQPLKRMVGNQNTLSSYNGKLMTDPSGRAFLQSSYANQALLGWNSEAKNFDIVLSPPQRSQFFGPGQNNGAWFTANDGKNTLLYQAAPRQGQTEPPAPVIVSPPAPKNWPVTRFEPNDYSSRPFAAWGSKVWYELPVRADYFGITDGNGRPSQSSRDALAAYDIAAKTWTQPLPLPKTNSSGNVSLLHTAGATYAATVAGNANGTVWKWSDATQKWQAIAPALPPETGLFENDEFPRQRPVIPVSADDKSVWVLVRGRMMARYDFAAKKWRTILLPPPLRQNPAPYYNDEQKLQAVQTGPDDFYVGTEAGLWHLHLSSRDLAGTWSAVERQVTLTSRPVDKSGNVPPKAEPMEFRLGERVVTPRYVWVVGTQDNEGFAFAARFDKTAKTWTTWDAKSGFPIQDRYASGLTAENDTVWLTSQSGTYRYEPTKKQWQVIVQNRNNNARIPDHAAVFKANGQTVSGSVFQIVQDKTSVYLLLQLLSTSSDVPQKPGDKTLLLRWDKESQTVEALPFPADFTASYAVGTAILNEPGTVWVGTRSDLWAWNKASRAWSRPAYPAALPFYTPTRFVRSDDALILMNSNYYYSDSTAHVVRLVGSGFAEEKK